MSTRDKIRIPVFNDSFLFNIYEELDIKEDKVDLGWVDENWQPEVWESYIGPRYDSKALFEIHRLMKFGTCPFCLTKMKQVDKDIQPGTIFVCYECFYYGGRGTRGWFEGPSNARGNLGRLKIIENLDEVSEDILIKHLSLNSEDIIKLTPKNAEKIVPVILKDYLNCEVKAIGGVKDGGIDALAIRGENSKLIIQIKWRETSKGSEAVSVVREVGGTLLSRGIPSGLLISTRKQFSKPAKIEADLISKNHVLGLGKLNIDLADFNDIIDMFNISCKKRLEIKAPQDIIPFWDIMDSFW